MTTYTFKPNASSQTVNWGDPTVWTGGVVPNSSDADVIFPLVTNVSDGSPYRSTIVVGSEQSFQTRSIQLDASDYLEVDGTLNVGAQFNQNGVLYDYGTLNASSLVVGNVVFGQGDYGTGTLNAGSVTNNSIIDSIDLQTKSLVNNGTLTASGNETITVAPGGFADLSGSTLTGGSYEAHGMLSLNVGAVIATDSANITLDGGMVQSFDDTTGQYVPLTTSLHSIGPTGSLTLDSSRTYDFGPLTVSGTLTLGSDVVETGALNASQLDVAAGGLVSGTGIINAPITNQGVISSGFGLQESIYPGINETTLQLQGPVTGNGTLEISPGSSFTPPPGAGYGYTQEANLELGGASSGLVKFDNNIGVLTLDAPSTFDGMIAPSGAGDVITLQNTSLDSITGESYSGDTAGGRLTLKEGATSIALNFQGDYNLGSFALSRGPQVLSSDPQSVDITVAAPVCFAAGTHIRILRDGVVLDAAVDQLVLSDLAVTSHGACRPIRWLGHRTIDCRRHPRPEAVLPIRIAAHAFGAGRPARDLFVSPGHAICLDVQGEILIPASALANDTTIRQIAVDKVTYWHVELDSHDLILAEGLPTESYLEMGNRGFFAEAALVTLAGAPDAPARARAGFCRPYCHSGPLVDAARMRMRATSCRADDPGKACAA